MYDVFAAKTEVGNYYRVGSFDFVKNNFDQHGMNPWGDNNDHAKKKKLNKTFLVPIGHIQKYPTPRKYDDKEDPDTTQEYKVWQDDKAQHIFKYHVAADDSFNRFMAFAYALAKLDFDQTEWWYIKKEKEKEKEKSFITITAEAWGR